MAMKTQYSVQVVTLIDILGFESIVNKTKPITIQKYYKTLRRIGGFEDGRNTTEQKFLNFSDTCVRTTPLVQSDGTGNVFGILWHELMDIVHLQSHMILEHNVFLRGAVTLGNVFNNGQELFGPAVIKAHKLESEVAIFPRVIVDPVVWKIYRELPHLRNEIHDYKTDREYVEKLLAKGDDGIWFVDYITAMESEFDNQSEFSAFLDAHKRMIVTRSESDSGGVITP